jgi:hypothetical protein
MFAVNRSRHRTELSDCRKVKRGGESSARLEKKAYVELFEWGECAVSYEENAGGRLRRYWSGEPPLTRSRLLDQSPPLQIVFVDDRGWF